MNEAGLKNRPLVSVYGSSMTPPDDPYCDSAVRIGTRLAEEGADGGYGGVMDAVSHGAVEAGRKAVEHLKLRGVFS